MAEAVPPLMIDVERMMRVLDRRNAVAAPRQLTHQLLDESGLSSILEASDTDDLVHKLNSAAIRSASASSSGVLTLKKGS